jgi:hypothetical protein
VARDGQGVNCVVLTDKQKALTLSSQQKLEAQRAKERADRDARIIAEWEEDKQAGYPISRGFRADNTKEIIHLDNIPIVRIVNDRDPVSKLLKNVGKVLFLSDTLVLGASCASRRG